MSTYEQRMALRASALISFLEWAKGNGYTLVGTDPSNLMTDDGLVSTFLGERAREDAEWVVRRVVAERLDR